MKATHMRKIGMSLILAILALAASQALTEEPMDKEQVFMRAKLSHSQKVLEGLALEDFKEIASSSNQLKLLSLDVNWQVLQTEEYIRQSKEFRRAADGLTAAAEKKNLDGAVLAYFQLTQSCVSCHKYVRDQR
jgi:cytochrome c556